VYKRQSVEGSRVRAQIARKRCLDLSNVKIYCGDLKQIRFDTQYDIVTLIGVLEYAPLFYSEADPYRACEELLQLARSALKPQGVLVIAIENSIGLKYWSGCPEDHTGILFDSIHGYPVKQSPHTFSKTEIQHLMQGAGLPENIFYSCFPDYKFTSVMFNHCPLSQELYLHNWISTPFSTPEHQRRYSFHEGLATRTLSHAGLLDQFANSFVILAGTQLPEALKNAPWVAKKISTERRAGYQCMTTLNTYPNLHIKKDPLEINMKSPHTYQYLNPEPSSPWIPGDLLIFDIYEALLQPDPAHHLEDMLHAYYSRLMELFSITEVDSEGYPLLKGEALDFIPRNVVKHNKTLVPIDLEWTMPGPIPADWVLFRCMRHDVIGSHYPYQKDAIPNPEQFKFDMMKRFFPSYTKERDARNLKNELAFQETVKIQFDLYQLYHAPQHKSSLMAPFRYLLRFFLRKRS